MRSRKDRPERIRCSRAPEPAHGARLPSAEPAAGSSHALRVVPPGGTSCRPEPFGRESKRLTLRARNPGQTTRTLTVALLGANDGASGSEALIRTVPLRPRRV